MSTYNVQLTEEARAWVIDYQAGRKKEYPHGEVNVGKCINAMIIQHKEQTEQIKGLSKEIERLRIELKVWEDGIED